MLPAAATALPSAPQPRCPVCDGERDAPLVAGVVDHRHGVPGRWSFVRCRSCGALWLDPRPIDPSMAYPAAYPQHEEPASPTAAGGRAARRLRDAILASRGYGRPTPGRRAAGRVASWVPGLRLAATSYWLLLPDARDGGRLLDVGCGNGRFMEVARSLGWDVEGIEPDEVSAELARRHTASRVHPSFEAAGYADGTFDVITMNHVLEHVADQRSTLRECHRVLRAGGMLGLVVPNPRSLGARTFGASWYGWEAPRHLVMFDRRSLARVVGAAGFRITSLATTSAKDAQGALRISWRYRRGWPTPAGAGATPAGSSARRSAARAVASRVAGALWSLASAVSSPFGTGEEIVLWARRP